MLNTRAVLYDRCVGTVDRDMLMDPKDCSLGYSWCPWREPGFTQKLFDEKANADDEPEGEPPTDIKTYNPRMCSWLRYRMLDQEFCAGDLLKAPSSNYKTPDKNASLAPSIYKTPDNSFRGERMPKFPALETTAEYISTEDLVGMEFPDIKGDKGENNDDVFIRTPDL